jgi:putative PIN family toxin of toxin-antitoxin system
MIRVVLDTNVIVSALLNPNGKEALVLLLCLRRQLAMCLSPAMLAEYQEVLYRPRLRLQPSEIEAVLAGIYKIGKMVRPIETLNISGDEPDNRVYECADAAQAGYIVTGNLKHFAKLYKRIKIVNARQLLEALP